MADDEILVAVDGEDAAGGEGNGGVSADPVAEIQSQFESLKARTERVEAEKSAALQRASRAEAAARQAQTEAATVRTEAIETEASSLDTAITSATSAIEAAKKEIKSAGEAGDHAAQAEAYDRLAAARADLTQLNASKREVDVRKAEAARPKKQPTEAADVAPAGDPFENYLSQFSAPTAAWMRDHREWVTDGPKSRKLNVAHDDALDAGLKADTPEYFEFVETKIGIRKAEPEPKPNGKDNGAVTVKTHQRRAPVAPVSSSSNGYGGGDNVVKLSKAQADAATDGTIVWNYDDPSGKGRFKKGDPIGHQEMARRVKSLKEQGAFDPNNISV